MANKYLHIGLGGRNCSCCFPAPGSKDRRARYRISKKKADREAMKDALADLYDPMDHIFIEEDHDYNLEPDWLDDYWRDEDLEATFADDQDDFDNRYDNHYGSSDYFPDDYYYPL